MSLKNPRFRKGATIATAMLVGAMIFGVATTARGASHRALAASLELTQTCSNRVEPGSLIDIQAVVQNSGDEDLLIPTNPDADAGTDDNPADDFFLTGPTGDNGNLRLDPGESWTYTGSFTAPDADVTNIVGVDAISTPGGAEVGDIAPCETDVIQQAEPGRIAGVMEVAGTVLVKEKGSNKFVPLNGETELPIGSQVNTLKGTVRLIAGLGAGKTNSGDFSQGIFTILQAKKAGAFMTLKMGGGNFGICRGGSSQVLSIESEEGEVAKTRKKRVRRLFANTNKGRFATRGRYGAATVRGTSWSTEDRCDGTLVKVLRGVVQVRDFRRHKTVKVRAGHSYLAKAPGA
jgi:hypothetical protein